MKRKSNKSRFSECANVYIRNLQEEGRYATAHVYKNAILSFSKFCGSSRISFEQITRDNLRRYGQHLDECGLKPNTVSTYMRMLRSIYNRGIEAGIARFIPRLFRDVFTGVEVRQKKALPVDELHTLLYKAPQSERLRRTQTIARLMFQFCGMPFSDFAHLEKSALEQGILRYKRIKTGTPMTIEVLDTSLKTMDSLRNHSSPEEGYPDYLFNIMKGDKKRQEEDIYKEYQSSLRRFNNQLKSLAKELRLKSIVTSYSIRHSWATIANYQGIPVEMISESLGHKSIKTTQTYLKSFGLRKRTEVNKMNCSYVEFYKNKSMS